MITYAERACFRPSHVRLLALVEACVARVSDAWGNELRCHELARAVRRVIGDRALTVVDGHCGPVEHSWLRGADGVIFDAYVPGRLPAVQVVDTIVARSYRPGPPRRDIRRALVRRLVVEMRADRSLAVR